MVNSIRLARSIKVLLAINILLVLSGVSSAQVMDSALQGVRTDSRPVIDGELNDECWKNAAVAEGFTSHQTEKPAIDQTKAFVVYDDEFIYVAFYCDEPEPDKIIATERKRDRPFWDEDYLDLQIDSMNGGRGTYVFCINALGTKYDAQMNIFGWNVAWDCVWEAKCVVNDDNWVAEMAIPIAAMHFERGKDCTWGINFHRDDKETQEESTWSFYRDDSFSPRYFGELRGLDLSKVEISTKPGVQAYVSSTISQKGGDDKMDTGADVAMRLSPNFVGAFTINPDFGQVEADVDTIELRDTERYLPERRDFFNDGAELFETPISVYYSRRIVDIDAGMKLTGMGKDWSMGVIDVQGQISRDGIRRDGNYSIARYMKNVGEESHIGAIFVNSQRDDGFNRVGGIDYYTPFGENWTFYGQGLAMFDKESDSHDTRSEYAVISSASYENRPLYFDVDFVDISEDFIPDLGYVPRTDIRGFDTTIKMMDDIDSGPIKWYYVRGSFEMYQNHDGETTLRDNYQRLGFDFRNNYSIRFWRSDNYHAPYNNREVGVELGHNTDEDYWHSIEGEYAHGEFEGVPYDSFGFEKPFLIGERFTSRVNAAYRIESPEAGDNTIWLWQWVNEYTFENGGRLKFTWEKSSEDRHHLMLLYAWEYISDYDFYAVFTDSRDGADEEQGVFLKYVKRF